MLPRRPKAGIGFKSKKCPEGQRKSLKRLDLVRKLRDLNLDFVPADLEFVPSSLDFVPTSLDFLPGIWICFLAAAGLRPGPLSWQIPERAPPPRRFKHGPCSASSWYWRGM